MASSYPISKEWMVRSWVQSCARVSYIYLQCLNDRKKTTSKENDKVVITVLIDTTCTYLSTMKNIIKPVVKSHDYRKTILSMFRTSTKSRLKRKLKKSSYSSIINLLNQSFKLPLLECSNNLNPTLLLLTDKQRRE
jgi:thioredoxin-related protein